MKELTPSGWIGMVIGIFVFACTVSHVASQTPPTKCWKKADSAKILHTNIMKDAFEPKNWKTDCAATENCLQYYPPASKGSLTGKVEVTVECGLNCAGTRDPATRMGNAEYLCHACNSGTACKTFAGEVKYSYKECFDYKGPKNSADLLYLKKNLCFDATCKYIDDAGTNTLTVGCQTTIDGLSGSGTKNDCDGTNSDCQEKIVASKCWKDSSAPIAESVAEITDAFAREKWTVVCSGSKKCLQYYPDTTNSKGKVQVAFECGDTCETSQTKMKRQGFTCTKCDTSVTSDGCKVLGTDVKTDKPCCSYSGPKGEANVIKNIYCLDSCQYAESDGGKILTVGCSEDIKFPGATLNNCPADDATCEKKIKVHQGSSSGPTTTAARRNNNKLTSSPTCLIASMATLLFAASQYILN